MTEHESEQQPALSRATVRRREGRTIWLLWLGLAVVLAAGLVWLLPFGLL